MGDRDARGRAQRHALPPTGARMHAWRRTSRAPTAPLSPGPGHAHRPRAQAAGAGRAVQREAHTHTG
eukprot:scaffold4424_cov113-Isochrysis_galbana.AAC.1